MAQLIHTHPDILSGWQARALEAEQERDRLWIDLYRIARYVMKNQDAIRDGNGMMELARMLDAALDAALDGGKE